ncbi:MAG: hydantoin racemase [Kordiimonadaceae bacterium]|jgi:Asp/Glu/hydantoin racemase|nr:hydantoin racemase [Kordiimonadaceae bacterium]MBT7545711.1 hydantoin racemase [Kordiimonadaceae bacterium]MBT7604609.1 hydantoin racemase [Kordiimonadaceae bacterium]MDC0112163.1 aspartate/glutamate racemase family protein [Emcibacteraceae bacterium]|tara:strand:- start:2537 stop:3220 length:684 start_codon:yes stop_codon:yes gene_type:complete
MKRKTKSRLLMLNANSSQSVTEGMESELAVKAALLNIVIDYDQIAAAPEAIESSEDVCLAHMLVTKHVQSCNYDAYVIACFCDPGVAELRALGYQNVFGIAESAMHVAANIGSKFGILSILDVSVERHIKQVERAGLSNMLAADLALNLGVLDLEDKGLARPRIEKVGRKLVKEFGATSIILGCAGMGIHRQWLQELLGVPVIDPCWAGMVMAMATLGENIKDTKIN